MATIFVDFLNKGKLRGMDTPAYHVPIDSDLYEMYKEMGLNVVLSTAKPAPVNTADKVEETVSQKTKPEILATPVPTVACYDREPTNSCVSSTVKCYFVFYPKSKAWYKRDDCVAALTTAAKEYCASMKCTFYESSIRCGCFAFSCSIPANISANKFARAIRVSYNKKRQIARLILPKFIVSSTAFTDDEILKNI